MRTVDAVLFDKTGTLTLGRPQVTGVATTDADPDALLRHADAVEADSEHPLARAAAIVAVGVILMSASTIAVALNAQLLRRLDLRPGQA
jgi:P-type Cu2+ transporter